MRRSARCVSRSRARSRGRPEGACVSDAIARACVVGASGYSGALAAAILWRHPQVSLEAVTARSNPGRRLDELYPRHRVPLELEPFDADRIPAAARAGLRGTP